MPSALEAAAEDDTEKVYRVKAAPNYKKKEPYDCFYDEAIEEEEMDKRQIETEWKAMDEESRVKYVQMAERTNKARRARAEKKSPMVPCEIAIQKAFTAFRRAEDETNNFK